MAMFRNALLLALSLAVMPAFGAERAILILGDSISAGYGMEVEQGWVYLLEQRLSQRAVQCKVINASISGETTGGGLIRLPHALERYQPELVIIELGGNDGLRGYPIDRIRENLDRMVVVSQEASAGVLLVGMMLPPNYGSRYSEAFAKVFHEVADARGVTLLPFLLEGVATHENLMQRDGIHPNPSAQAMLLDNIWPEITELLRE